MCVEVGRVFRPMERISIGFTSGRGRSGGAFGVLCFVGAGLIGLTLNLTFAKNTISYRSRGGSLIFRRRKSAIAVMRVTHPTGCLLLPVRRDDGRKLMELSAKDPTSASVSIHLTASDIRCCIPFTLPRKDRRTAIVVGGITTSTLY